MVRALRYGLLSIAALAVLAALAILALATPRGRSLLASVVERAASGGGLDVSIGTLLGWPPFAFGADRIVLSDADGAFAEIAGLDVDLDVRALFGGAIAFDALAAERVAIARRPVLESTGGGEAGLFPLAARRLDIASLELGPGLIGEAATLAVAGAFAFGADGSIRARLDAERTDGRTGAVAASIERADGEAPVALDLTLEEAADGILLGLMGRPSGPGYRLVARSAIDGGAVDGAVSLTSDGDARFSGRIGLSGGDAGRRLVVTGEGDLAELVPPGFEDLLAGRIAIAVDAEWRALPDAALPLVTIREAEASTATLSVSAAGTFGGPQTDMSLTLEAARPGSGAITLPVGGAEPIRVDTVSLSGRVAPADGARRLDLLGRIGGFAAGAVSVPGIGLSLAVEAEGDDPTADADLPFALRIEADAIDTAAGRIAATAAAPLLLTADGVLDIPTRSAQVDADLSGLGGRVLYSGEVSAEAMTGEARARFADIAALGSLLGRDLGGAVQATLNGQFFGPDGLSLAVAGAATDLDIGEASLGPLLAGQTAFAFTLADGPETGLAVRDLAVSGEALSLAGDFALDGRDIDGSFSGEIADLAALAAQSEGAAAFSATIAGSLDRPTFDAEVSVASGRLMDQPIESATVRVEGEPVDGGWRGALSLAGSFAGRPLEGTAEAVLDTDAGRMAFPEVDLTIAENRITGSIEEAGGGLLAGSLSVSAPNLATLAALVLVEATGTAEATVRLVPDAGRQAVAISFAGRGIAAGTVMADEADGEVRIDDAFGQPQIAGHVEATGVAAGTLRLDTVRLTAGVEGATTRFEGAVRGPDLNLTGAGSLAPEAGGQRLRIAALDGNAFGFPVALSAPASLLLGDETRVESASLALGGGTVSVSGPVAPALDLVVTIDRVAASVADRFAPGLGAQGTITGRATVSGTTAAPRIAWQADWNAFGVADTRSIGLPALSVSARGEATATATTLTARLAGAGVALDVSGSVPFDGRAPDIRAAGTAPLELVALFTDRELDLGGTARVDLAIAGAGAISGTVDITDATLVDAETRFGVTAVAGRIRLAGHTATVERLAGRMAQGGAITLGGTITLDPDVGVPANLTVDIANGRYYDGSMVDAAYTASLRLTGPLLTTGTVAGRIDVSRAEILLPDHFGGAHLLDVRHVNVEPGFVPPVPPQPDRSGAAAGGGGGLNLDITVASTSRSSIIVRGYGIDAELGGSVRVTGTTGSPVTIGAFELLRGRIEVLGRRFDFTSGRLTFAGGLVPILDFEATTRTSEVTVTVNVTGPADNPQISFTSSPNLPEEEVIARLLFDRGVGNLTAFQAAQLVDAIGQFSGAFARGDGLFSRVRRLTGLDDLDIRQNEAGGTTVGIGRRINDNIRLGVEQDTRGSGRVTIDLDLTRNLKARGEAGGDGSSKFGLTYEREY